MLQFLSSSPEMLFIVCDVIMTCDVIRPRYSFSLMSSMDLRTCDSDVIREEFRRKACSSYS